MAGIGFELRKVMGKGGLGSFLKASLSGIMIVAGPWLLSIVGITVILRILSSAVKESQLHFLGAIIYSYAWSLILFGGFHFIFTRSIADFIFEKKEEDAAGMLLFFSIPVVLVASVMATVAVSTMKLDFQYPGLFRFGAVLLFATVNLIWMAMIFISLLKWFVRILAVYVVGMGAAIFLVYFLGQGIGIAGAMIGFAGGHLFIALLLLFLAFSAYRPRNISKAGKVIIDYLKRFWLLLLTGLFYNGGMWIDKIVYWFTQGEQVPGTFISLFPSYDIAVYFANLTMIPGLVYFVVVSETGFYILLRRFLVSLNRGTYAEIQRRKMEMLRGMLSGLREQSLFQSVFTVVLIIIAPTFARIVIGGSTSVLVLRISLAGVFFHLAAMTLMNFLFYLEFYRHALRLTAIFFFVNLALSILAGLDVVPIPPGTSYSLAGIAATIYGAIAAYRSGLKIDRKIFSGVGSN